MGHSSALPYESRIGTTPPAARGLSLYVKNASSPRAARRNPLAGVQLYGIKDDDRGVTEVVHLLTREQMVAELGTEDPVPVQTKSDVTVDGDVMTVDVEYRIGSVVVSVRHSMVVTVVVVP